MSPLFRTPARSPPLQRIENFCRRPLPDRPFTPTVRNALKADLKKLQNCLDPLPITELPRYVAKELTAAMLGSLSLIDLLVEEKAGAARIKEYKNTRHQTTHANRRVLAQSAGSRVEDHEICTADSELAVLTSHANSMMVAGMPALIDTLEQMGQIDMASYFREASAELISAVKAPKNARLPWCIVDSGKGVAAMLRQVLTQVRTPTDLPEPPVYSSPLNPNDHGEFHERMGKILLWVSDATLALAQIFDEGNLQAYKSTAQDNMLKVLQVYGEAQKMFASTGRLVPDADKSPADAVKHCKKFVRTDASDVKSLTAEFHAWQRAIILSGKKLIAAAQADDPPAGLPAATPPSEPVESAKQARNRNRDSDKRKKAQGATVVPDPHKATELAGGPSPRSDLRVMPVNVHNTPRPTRPAGTTSPDRPAWTTMSPLAAAPHLQQIAGLPRGEEKQAATALHAFLRDRELRAEMTRLPPERAYLVLDPLAALVDRCTEGGIPLYLFDMRKLLDAAWASPGRESRQALIDSVLNNFAAAARASVNAFRGFGLAGGISKLLRVLPDASPQIAANAARALASQLQEIRVHDADRNPSGAEDGPFFPREFQQAVAQHRLFYQRVYPLTAQQRDDSATNMKSALATALLQLSPYAAAPGLTDLTQELALLHGLELPELSNARTPESLSRRAVDLVINSASCKLRPKDKLVEIDAHNLSAHLLEATLRTLSADKSPSGRRQNYTAFELMVGGTHDDGVSADLKARDAVRRWRQTLPAGWQAQHDGKATIYVHFNRPKNGWATYFQ